MSLPFWGNQSITHTHTQTPFLVKGNDTLEAHPMWDGDLSVLWKHRREKPWVCFNQFQMTKKMVKASSWQSGCRSTTSSFVSRRNWATGGDRHCSAAMTWKTLENIRDSPSIHVTVCMIYSSIKDSIPMHLVHLLAPSNMALLGWLRDWMT